MISTGILLVTHSHSSSSHDKHLRASTNNQMNFRGFDQNKERYHFRSHMTGIQGLRQTTRLPYDGYTCVTSRERQIEDGLKPCTTDLHTEKQLVIVCRLSALHGEELVFITLLPRSSVDGCC